MTDGTIVNSEKAVQQWQEATDWNGSNHISRATGTQWDHQCLFLSSKGRFWLLATSQWQGSTASGRYVDNAEAAAWLLENDHALPPMLESLEDAIEE
jgi:hypothetical protein